MYTFTKEERLCSKKLLGELFDSGSSFLVYPLRITFLLSAHPGDQPAQVMIGVSKRKFKRAVDRNLLKRRMREAYRLNKSELLYPYLSENGFSLIFAIHYIGKGLLDFHFIEKKMKDALRQLVKSHAEKVG
jgi:ribonuclease P protein component